MSQTSRRGGFVVIDDPWAEVPGLTPEQQRKIQEWYEKVLATRVTVDTPAVVPVREEPHAGH